MFYIHYSRLPFAAFTLLRKKKIVLPALREKCAFSLQPIDLCLICCLISFLKQPQAKKKKQTIQPMHTLETAAGNLWPISLIHINLTMCSKPKHIEVPIFGVLLVAHKGLFLPSTQVLDRSTKAQLNFKVLLQRKRSRDYHNTH